MSDIDLLKAGIGGGIGLAAIYVVFLVVRLLLSHLDRRNKASDELALKTIDVVGKDSEALTKNGIGLDKVGTGLQDLAKALAELARAVVVIERSNRGNP